MSKTTFIGAAAGSNGTTSTFSAYNQVAGHCIVVAVLSYNAAVSSITDTAGNDANYTAVTAAIPSGTDFLQFFYVPNCLGNTANAIVVHCVSAYVGAMAWDITNAASASPVQTEAHNTGSSTSPQSTGFTDANTNDSIINAIGIASGYATGSAPYVGSSSMTIDGQGGTGGNQILGSHIDNSGLYSSVNTGGTISPSAPWIQQTVAFKSAPIYSISGNCGTANANVGYDGAATGIVTADGSGNYSITGLYPGSYIISCGLAGKTFSPLSIAETITNSNLTGQNFTAVSSTLGPSLLLANKLPANVAISPADSITFGPWNLTPGNTVVIAVTANNNSYPAHVFASVSDTAGNTWIQGTQHSSNPTTVQFWYCYNTNGNAANTVTVTLTGAPNHFRQTGYLWEIAGPGIVDPKDVDSYGPNNGTSPAISHIFGTSQANELLLSFAVVGGGDAGRSFTAGSGYTLDSGTVGNSNTGVCAGAQHQLLTARQLYTTASMNWSGGAAVPDAVIAVLGIKDANIGSPLSSNFGVWSRVGIVSPDVYGQVSVIYEGSAKILSTAGNVFKMWMCAVTGGNLAYLESFDGISWVSRAAGAVMTGTAYSPGKVFKNSGTYYLYTSPTYTPSQIDAFTSPDGIVWTKQKSATLTLGTGWEGSWLGQLSVLGIIAGTWYGYYAGENSVSVWAAGLATSSDGISWTKSGSNPIITQNQGTAPTWSTVSSNYYGITQGDLPAYPQTNDQPSDVFMFSGSNPSGPFITTGFPVLYRTTSEEGVTLLTGQVADPIILEVNGNVYCYATKASDGTPATYAVECFIAYGTTIAQLVAGNQGLINVPVPTNLSATLSTQITDSFASSLSASWHQLSSVAGFCAAQWLSANKIGAVTVGSNADSYNSSQSWYQDQWAQIVVETCAVGSTVGISLRQNTSGTATTYRFYWTGTAGNPGTFKIDYCAAGASTTLGTGTVTVALGDTLTAVAIANNLMFYHNGYLLDVVQDSNITSGSAGFLVNPVTSTANAAIGSFASGNLGYSIGGNAGIAGATVSYSGTSSGSVTADGSGNYSLTGLANGIYTITPSKTGYTFSPASANETVSGADITGVNFTATQASNGGAWFLLDQVSFLEDIPRRRGH